MLTRPVDGEGLINALVKLVSEASDDAAVVSSFTNAVASTADKNNVSARLHVYGMVWYGMVWYGMVMNSPDTLTH